jgi:TRAP-type C4-dicarboxylate transport system permease small subunit
MSSPKEPLAFFDRLVVPVLGIIAAVVLFCLMALTCVDVVARYFFNSPVYGGFEITEMLLAVLIFSGLPLVTLRNEHVTVDVLDPITPQWLLRARHVAACLVGLIVDRLSGVRLWLRASALHAAGETTAQLKFKLAYLTSPYILMACTAVALLVWPCGDRNRITPERYRPVIEALIGFAAFLALAFVRVPMAFAMGIVGFTCGLQAELQYRCLDDRPDHLRDRASYTLSVIPLFILMGSFVVRARISDDSITPPLLSRPPARRPCHVTVVACGALAPSAAPRLPQRPFTKVAYPPMQSTATRTRWRWARSRRAALSILIPPSVIMVIYGLLTETSIAGCSSQASCRHRGASCCAA